jgi:acetyl-CoA carboxylase alpha subunit
MAPADRVIAWENAVFSVIAPEGAATILYRDSARAPELAESLRITVGDLVEMGIVDDVVPEPSGGAQSSPREAAQDLAAAIGRHISDLAGLRSRSRLRRRHERWRKLTHRYIQQA